MTDRILTAAHIEAYARFLRTEERSSATIEKYLHDIRAFAAWLDGRVLKKDLAACWKEQLSEEGLAPSTVNARLSALNGLLRFLGWEDCRIKFLKLQRRVFRDPARELSKEEYRRLLDTARRQGREMLALLMETICAAGLRVSEVRYITVEAARLGRAEIRMKGKIRTILLPSKLCRKLLREAKRQKTASGEIFLGEDGRALSRVQIWRAMKSLCKKAKVEPSKVFPHNLRHLFATAFYQATKDIVKLADVLGHNSINTTRIYLLSTGVEHARQLERLGLVS